MAVSPGFFHFQQIGWKSFSAAAWKSEFPPFPHSTISTPYGGPACPGHGRPAQGRRGWADATAGSTVSSSVFGVRSHYASARQTAITLCRNGRHFGPNTSPVAFARRDRAGACGAPALPGDGISPRPPCEFLIRRSERSRFLGPYWQSAFRDDALAFGAAIPDRKPSE
jgi:hypothetical protein